MSRTPLPSGKTRFVAEDAKATKRPSAEIAGSPLSPLPSIAPGPRFTRLVTPVTRSWTKMSRTPLPSGKTRFVAEDVKATKRPSAEIAGSRLSPLPSIAPRPQAHTSCHPRHAVMDEDVPHSIAIRQNQVCSGGREGHETPIGRDCRPETPRVGLIAATPHAGSFDYTCHTVMDEDVLGSVAITRHEVGS